MEHYNWIKDTFDVFAFDDESRSILFEACGELCCEINGTPFACHSKEEFYDMVELFRGETFEE